MKTAKNGLKSDLIYLRLKVIICTMKRKTFKEGIMRTNEEIVAKIEAILEHDWLGFETSDLVIRLPFNQAKKFLKPDTKEEDWETQPKDKDSILKEMEDYMPFAWEKANNFRGISASRNMSHYMAWIWLLGDDFGNLHDYEYYGKDNLKKICEHYGWDSFKWDDGVRLNEEP